MNPFHQHATPYFAPPRNAPAIAGDVETAHLLKDVARVVRVGAVDKQRPLDGGALSLKPLVGKPAPRPVMRETSATVSAQATAAAVVVLPMPISPVAISL
jgi:hypothetical protein